MSHRVPCFHSPSAEQEAEPQVEDSAFRLRTVEVARERDLDGSPKDDAAAQVDQ
jgi:hypothetical protein